MSTVNTKIIIATHKPYNMPKDDVYLPVQAGAGINPRLEYTGDDSGDNISGKNKNFCELTVLYWAWKNLDADYIGLCHYRRYFARSRFGDKAGRILTSAEWEKILSTTDVVAPVKRNYYIETNYSQYVHAHHKEDLDATRQILLEKYPEYVAPYDDYMKKTKGHKFNMLVMKKELLDGYCSWLFDILFELERRLDITDYSAYDKRVYGFVSERLLDVWMITNNIQYKELPVVNMENQHWLKKGMSFIARKFKNKR